MIAMIVITLVAYFFYNIDALYLLLLLPCMVSGFVFSNKVAPIDEQFYEKRKSGMKLSEEIYEYVQRRLSKTGMIKKGIPTEIKEVKEELGEEEE